MAEYDYADENVATDPEPDPRIIAMHQVVDLEQQYEQATREAEHRQKLAAIVQNELREARDRLAGLLGYPSNANKPMASGGMIDIRATR
jgi:hypothetical protein